MAYILRANNKDYLVDDHAAKRMLERFILDEMVIETLEHGTLYTQPHGRDLYEHHIYDETLDSMVTIQVIVEETSRMIITVMDTSEVD